MLASTVAVLADGKKRFSLISSISWVKLRSMNFHNYFECEPVYSALENAQAMFVQLWKKSPILCSLLRMTFANLSQTAVSPIPSAATGITKAKTSAVSRLAFVMF